MTDEVQTKKSDPLDSPVLTEALIEVLCAADGGSYAGYCDGREGRTKRTLPSALPELFHKCYEEGYARGQRDREIVQLEKERGCCIGNEEHNNSVPAHKTGISNVSQGVNSGSQSTNTEGAMENTNQSFWKKAGPIIAAGVAGMTLGGIAGVAIGRKQQANKERELGIISKDQVSGNQK